MGILWTILIGFIAGVLAKLITPGDNEPSGLYPDHNSGDRWRIRGHLPGPGSRLVSSRPGCWPHWCDRRGYHRATNLGSYCWQAEEYSSLERQESLAAGPTRSSAAKHVAPSVSRLQANSRRLLPIKSW